MSFINRKKVRMIVPPGEPPDLHIDRHPARPGAVTEVGPLEVAAFESRGWRRAKDVSSGDRRPPETKIREKTDVRN